MGLLSRIMDVAELALRRGRDGRVPLRWLAKPPSKLYRQFAARADVRTEQAESEQIVHINGRVYAWPKGVPTDDLISIVSEVEEPEHPHQYLWGPTQAGRGDVVMDIGACEGSFAAHVAELGAQVVAVEPSRLMARILRRLFELRGLPQPQVLDCALAGRNGEAHFLDNPTNPPASALLDAPCPGSYPVPVRTLDEAVESLGLARLDLVKCDAEGADVGIVRSGERTLRRLRPRLAICTYHGDSDYNELHEFLTALGYRVQGKGFLHAGRRFRVMMLHAS